MIKFRVQGYNKLCKSQSSIQPATPALRFIPLLCVMNCIGSGALSVFCQRLMLKAPLAPYEYIWSEHVMLRMLKKPQASV